MNDDEFFVKNVTPLPREGEVIEGFVLGPIKAYTLNSIIFDSSSPETGMKVVLKFIFNEKQKTESIEEEVHIMQNFVHPHLARALYVFHYKQFVVLVMETALGATLFEMISTKKPAIPVRSIPKPQGNPVARPALKPGLKPGSNPVIHEKKGIPEDVARYIMQQLLDALEYMHASGYVHRDIKPENILIQNTDFARPYVLLSDFGISKQIAGGEKLTQSCGTLSFLAPEMFTGKPYDEKIDIWALGVTLYMMLTGSRPFPPVTNKVGLRQAIINGKYKITGGVWNSISPECIDFVKLMLTVDPESRISAAEARAHPWITQGQCTQIETDLYRYLGVPFDAYQPDQTGSQFGV